MIKIKEYILITHDTNFIYFEYRSKLKINYTNDTLNITKKLIKGIELNCLKEEYNEKKVNTIVTTLSKHNMLTHCENIDINPIEERFFSYLDQYNDTPSNLYKKLNNSVICIIGVGGIGGNIIQVLASSGIKNYILIDFDKVELSNLNRQYLYDMNDIGYNKVDICRDKLNALDLNIKCHTFTQKINCKEDLVQILDNFKNIDIIIGGADSPIGINEVIKGVAKDKKCAYISGGLGIDYGSYSLFDNNHLEIDCKKTNDVLDIKFLNNQVPFGSFGATNSIISSFMALDIVNYLIEKPLWSNNSKIIFDFKETKFLKK